MTRQEPIATEHPSEPETDHSGERRGRPSTRRIDSSALFQGSPRVVIEHRGEEYRLQETRQGKLILTK